MAIEIGTIDAIFRYPVKSMRGESLDVATLGWHGLDGDRRLALRRVDDQGAVPFLTAAKLAELVLFTPVRRQERRDDAKGEPLPTHVRTPEGDELPIFGEALAAEIGRRHGTAVEMMQMRTGIFDDAALSLIAIDTVREICRRAGKNADARRFRPNVVLRTTRAVAFEEDGWLGGVITFGDDEGPAVAVTTHDVRCAMVNIDPDDGTRDAEVMKAAVRANNNNAGVYTTVTRTGRISVGQRVMLHR